jgi:hypothetical protein
MCRQTLLRLSLGFVFSFLLLATTGCGTGYSVAPVSGQVTLDGDPLPDASVTFQPVAEQDSSAGLGSYGRTDENGRYSLKLIENDQEGAAVGKHRVQISAQSDDSDSDAGTGAATEKVPSRYRDAETILTFDVPADGTDQADFPLTTEP